MVFLEGDDGADVVGVDTEALADVEELLVGARRLTAGHSGDVVVKNHDDDVGFFVDAVEETSHATVAESAVADDADGGEDAHFRGALGHSNGSAHADGGVDGAHVEAEGVASDVAEDAAVGVFFHNLDDSLITVDVGATHAESWRTVGDHLGDSGAVGDIHAESLGDFFGVEFTIAADSFVDTAVDRFAFAKETFDVLFDEGLAIFEDEDFVDLVIELVEHVEGQGVLSDFDDRIGALAAGEILLEVVEGDASGDDAAAFVGAFEVLVETAFLAAFGKGRLFVDKVAVESFSVDGEQDEALRVGGAGERVLRESGFALNAGAAVSQTGRDAVEDGGAQFFAEFVAKEDHIVGFLLVAGFEHGDHGPVAVVAAVLFVLAGEHGGVVGNDYDNTFSSDDGSVHEGVAANIETHMLHACHGTFAGVSDTDGGLEGGFFVCAPVGYDAFFFGFF